MRGCGMEGEAFIHKKRFFHLSKDVGGVMCIFTAQRTNLDECEKRKSGCW